MIIKSSEVLEAFKDFNNQIKESQNIAIFTRDLNIQKEEVEKLENYINSLQEIKKSNRTKYTEDELNLLMCIILSADTIKCELLMLIALKENNMDSAWSYLVEAQNTISLVSRNHPFNPEMLNGYISKLTQYEKTLFPRMAFSSIGSIIKKSRCTICNNDYNECDHIKGKLYGGEICAREILDAEIEEVSIVDNPANKLCRQLACDRKGKTVNILTLVPKESP